MVAEAKDSEESTDEGLEGASSELETSSGKFMSPPSWEFPKACDPNASLFIAAFALSMNQSSSGSALRAHSTALCDVRGKREKH